MWYLFGQRKILNGSGKEYRIYLYTLYSLGFGLDAKQPEGSYFFVSAFLPFLEILSAQARGEQPQCAAHVCEWVQCVPVGAQILWEPKAGTGNMGH